LVTQSYLAYESEQGFVIFRLQIVMHFKSVKNACKYALKPPKYALKTPKYAPKNSKTSTRNYKTVKNKYLQKK
jgi:hypothetical protein